MIKDLMNRYDVDNLLKDADPLDDYSIEAVRALAECESKDDVPYNTIIEYAYNAGAILRECEGVCEISMPGRETVYLSSSGDCATRRELDGAGLYTVPGVMPYTFYDIANMITPGACKLSTHIKRLLNSHSFCGVERVISTAGKFLSSESAYAFTELAREYYEKEIKPYEND